MQIQAKRQFGILGVVILLLFIPFTAMQFTDQVNWKPSDFIVAGVLLFSAAALFELVFRKIEKMEYRVILGIAILALCLLIWAELAVGIFGTPFAGS